MRIPSELDLIFNESSSSSNSSNSSNKSHNDQTNGYELLPIVIAEDEYLEPNKAVMSDSIDGQLKRHNSSSTISSHCTSLSRDESTEETYEIVNDTDAQPVIVNERPRLPKPKESQTNNKSKSIGNVFGLQKGTSKDKKSKDKVDIDSNLVDNSNVSLSMDAINNNNLFGNEFIGCH